MLKSTKRKSASFIALTLALSILFSAMVAVAATPEEVARERTDAVVAVLRKPADSERTQELVQIINASLDFEELSRRFLGEYWEARSEAEQAEFLGLLQRLLRASYEDRLGDQQLRDDFQIEYEEARIRRDRAFVRAEITHRDRAEDVVYRLYLDDEQAWRIYDLVIDDISLEETYREGYVPIVEEDGWEELIRLMKERVDEMEEK